MRHDCLGEQAHHCETQRLQKDSYVEWLRRAKGSAGLDRRTFIRQWRRDLIVHELAKMRS
jgi:hypothetical protein